MTTRRGVMVLIVGALLAAPAALGAQPSGKVVRIGYLNAESASNSGSRLEEVRAGFRDLGYVEGKNFVIEARWAEGNYDRLPELAAELVRLNVDVIVTTGTKATLGAKRATSTIPIVMASSGDVVAAGIVASLARPGGNITGMTNLGRELGPKRLELIKQAVPRLSRVGYLVNPENPAFGPNLRAMWVTAKPLELELQPFEARGASEIDGAFSEMVKRRMDALVVQDETSFDANRARIVDRAAKDRLPSAGGKVWAEAGGLIGYGPIAAERDRRAAVFVDKILKGAKPADLPIEQPTRFYLVVNLKTAKALGLTIPQSLLLRADEVIQ